MYLWIGLGVNKNKEKYIRDYCMEINKEFNVNEQSFTLPQHISLKTSFKTDEYKKIINDLKNIFSKNKKITLKVEDVEMVPGVIWLNIEETEELRNYHNTLLKYLKDNYNIDKVGYDGDTFKFHSTLFQDVDNKELVGNLYKKIDKNKLLINDLEVDRIYFGISEIGKVGTYEVVDYIDLLDEKIIEINDENKLKEALNVLLISYRDRDEKLGLSQENNMRHSSLTYDQLKEMYDSGIKMYGYYKDEKIIAFISLEHRAEELKIKDIVVLPEYQSSGIGTELLNFAKDQAIKNNKSKIILGMIYANEKLRKWYEKYGFKIYEIVEFPSTGKVARMEYLIK